MTAADPTSGRDRAERGHRALPHTADLRIEAWAPTREGCLAEAVAATVEAFADPAGARPSREHLVELGGAGAEDRLVALLDEVVYRLDSAGEVPVATEVTWLPEGLRVRLAMADAASLAVTGAVPKAVTWHRLEFGGGPSGWRCAVTLDV
nr:archease [Streptomyces sp. SID5468]